MLFHLNISRVLEKMSNVLAPRAYLTLPVLSQSWSDHSHEDQWWLIFEFSKSFQTSANPVYTNILSFSIFPLLVCLVLCPCTVTKKLEVNIPLIIICLKIQLYSAAPFWQCYSFPGPTKHQANTIARDLVCLVQRIQAT